MIQNQFKINFVSGLVFLSFLVRLLVVPSAAQANPLTSEAKQIYQEHHPAIVQVRVISRGSGEKSSLGSGFFFADNGLIASNYHVVSDAVNYPSLFYVEYVAFDGKRGTLEILNIDPVHDLAILRASQSSSKHLILGNSDLEKGARIFSFGNPYDLGMIIVEGLFNGLLEHAMYRKILFSGSLNPGMSGGPAVLDDGSVFGVNVSSAGNEISFFVPVEYLVKLHKEVQANNGESVGPRWHSVIRKRLVRAQEDFLKKILKEVSWERDLVGIAKVPSEISKEFKCWGKSGENRKFWVKDEYLTCSTEDSLFISPTLYTGMIYFQYEWYVSRWKDPVRFYNIYEDYAANREFIFRNAQERDVSNFVCKQEFVDIDGHRCKVETCARSYTAFEGLFDINFQITSTDMLSDGFVINGAMLGFTESQGTKFISKFFREIEWQK